MLRYKVIASSCVLFFSEHRYFLWHLFGQKIGMLTVLEKLNATVKHDAVCRGLGLEVTVRWADMTSFSEITLVWKYLQAFFIFTVQDEWRINFVLGGK